jgi:hypothetical protein
MLSEHKKAQAAMDMLISYGIVILIISIALYVVLQLGVFNNRLAPTYCNAASSFSCINYAIAPSGNLTLVLSQSTTASINITGIACNTEANTVSAGPEYGNVGVWNYTKDPTAYPTNQLKNLLTVYPSTNVRVNVYCYSGGAIATSGLGHTYTGYVWLNYTISDLPSNFHNVQQVISFATKYS